MQIQSEELDAGLCKVSMSGRLDMQGAQEIETQLAAMTSGKSGKVVVDISEVSFLASLGLRTLLSTAKSLAKAGGKMVLVGPQANVAEVLKVSGIYNIIPIYDSMTSAMQALQ